MRRLRNSKTLKILRNCSLYSLYIVLIIATLVSVGEVNTIITYNTNGVNYLQSSHLADKYVPKPVEPEEVPVPMVGKYRLTSFYPNDELKTGDCTGSGYCSWDLQLNERGWYTYHGKLVIAAATTYLQKRYGVKEGKAYFKYYFNILIFKLGC